MTTVLFTYNSTFSDDYILFYPTTDITIELNNVFVKNIIPDCIDNTSGKCILLLNISDETINNLTLLYSKFSVLNYPSITFNNLPVTKTLQICTSIYVPYFTLISTSISCVVKLFSIHSVKNVLFPVFMCDYLTVPTV